MHWCIRVQHQPHGTIPMYRSVCSTNFVPALLHRLLQPLPLTAGPLGETPQCLDQPGRTGSIPQCFGAAAVSCISLASALLCFKKLPLVFHQPHASCHSRQGLCEVRLRKLGNRREVERREGWRKGEEKKVTKRVETHCGSQHEWAIQNGIRSTCHSENTHVHMNKGVCKNAAVVRVTDGWDHSQAQSQAHGRKNIRTSG